ncbi:MAG: RNA polymerase sigma factor [Chitinophagales bacterium]|nr:RNA polymerase sigma factor [Chitinophagales bacterium]
MSDKEILETFHAGQRERAFVMLMEAYQQRIYYHIRRMVKRHEDADDIMQNTFLKIWNGLPNFRAESQLFTWIYRIATNETISFLQHQGRHTAISFEQNELQDDTDYSPSRYVPGDSYEIDEEALLQKLQRAIDTLPDKQKLVFHMRYYDGLSYEQMSEILGTSEGALKANYHHAVRKIEKFLLEND